MLRVLPEGNMAILKSGHYVGFKANEISGFDLRLETQASGQFTVVIQENLEDMPTSTVNFDSLEKACVEYDRLSAGYIFSPKHAASVAMLNAIMAKRNGD